MHNVLYIKFNNRLLSKKRGVKTLCLHISCIAEIEKVLFCSSTKLLFKNIIFFYHFWFMLHFCELCLAM